jgi:hypothetical protein
VLAIRSIHVVLEALLTTLLWPLRSCRPEWALASVSLASGAVFLWAFGRLSNQAALRVLRDRARGNLMAVRFYGHDLRVVLSLQARVLRDTLVGLRYLATPLALLTGPMVLWMAALHLYFDRVPGRVGDIALLRAEGVDEARLVAPQGIVIETEPVRIRQRHEMLWRIRANAPGLHRLVLETPAGSVVKRWRVGPWGATPTLRSASVWDALLFPGEPPLTGDVERIRIVHAPASYWGLPWWGLFLALSLAAGLALKGWLGVEV